MRYVYGLAAGGSFSICCLINVMSQKEGRRCAEQNTVVPLASCTFALSLNLCQKFCQQAPGIDLYSTMSILGYGPLGLMDLLVQELAHQSSNNSWPLFVFSKIKHTI